MKRLPKAIQIFFTDDRNGNELAHDYYLNAAWVTDLCDRMAPQTSVGLSTDPSRPNARRASSDTAASGEKRLKLKPRSRKTSARRKRKITTPVNNPPTLAEVPLFSIKISKRYNLSSELKTTL